MPVVIADAEKIRAFRARLLHTFRDQTSFDSFCIDYFPQTKRERFAANSNKESQLNTLLEVEGLEALRQAYEHYLKDQGIEVTPKIDTRRIALIYGLLGFMVAMVLIFVGVLLFLPDYRAIQTASELQSSCNKGNAVSCQRLIEHHKHRCESKKWDDCVSLGDYYWMQQDKGRAYSFYRTACGHDRLLGCYYMALLTERGDGVPTDLREARSQYERLCKNGIDKACSRLGDMNLYGLAGAKNPAEAIKFFQILFQQKQVDANGHLKVSSKALKILNGVCREQNTKSCDLPGQLATLGYLEPEPIFATLTIACEKSRPTENPGCGWLPQLRSMQRQAPANTSLAR